MVVGDSPEARCNLREVHIQLRPMTIVYRYSNVIYERDGSYSTRTRCAVRDLFPRAGTVSPPLELHSGVRQAALSRIIQYLPCKRVPSVACRRTDSV